MTTGKKEKLEDAPRITVERIPNLELWLALLRWVLLMSHAVCSITALNFDLREKIMEAYRKLGELLDQ